MSTAAERPRLTVRDAHVMRALAHPARFAIVEHLMSGDPRTATECAEVVGLTPSATSYHLRALARIGLIEEAPSRGDGRERVWQSRVSGVNLAADTDDDPETLAAERDLVTMLLGREEVQIREWLARFAHEPRAWRDATAIAEARLLMTAEELTELNNRLDELIAPYRLGHRRHDPPPGARHVTVVYRSYATD